MPSPQTPEENSGLQRAPHQFSLCLPRLETGRFERPRLEEEERICPVCEDDQVENEEHAMFFCRAYSELRRNWLESLDIPPDFSNLELCQKFKIVLNESSNVKSTA